MAKPKWQYESGKVLCAYSYPEDSRERGRACDHWIWPCKSGRCSEHLSCGVSKRGKVTQISLEQNWSVWK